MDIVVCVLLCTGLFFSFMCILGLFRFPDVYTRLHASTKGTTFGALFIITAVVVRATTGYNGGESITIIFHSILAFLFIVFTNPVGSHAIARGAYKNGIKPYGVEIDDLDPKKRNIIVETTVENSVEGVNNDSTDDTTSSDTTNNDTTGKDLDSTSDGEKGE